ncbi:Low temperature requirement protein LtrA [Agromyces sp. CF514]|uniref:low temperature requirement protein A n=1 Tax=Agromyces sp. CF514 TaxID=1881031 RepID=UPI0008E67D47|nr:low temperature requirement protein A [Agromyces sp. CF514]SFR87506.1 Low temperature requirement protein LtrA [Agromyces sp. CF514]
MTQAPPPPLHHRLRRMVGRDPNQAHRAATPLELLYDLTFVVAFSQAGSQAAHLLELGHFGSAAIAFAFAVFAICWAWINYSWLASAYDNDGVFLRIATMVQMLGVLVLALGLPEFFESIDEGHHVDNAVVIAGYVVMRVSTIALWLRIAHDDPSARRTAHGYAISLGVIQVAWVAMIFVDPPLVVALGLMFVLGVCEMIVPLFAERRGGETPWHPHHIAERYSLLVIITLGEIVLGTILAISAVVEEQQWSTEAAGVALGGTLLVFGLWWSYFTVPSGRLLAAYRSRSYVWGYGHIVVFGSLAATGAGLHVAANAIAGEAHITDVEALLTIAVPVAVFLAMLFLLYSYLLRRFDPFHLVIFVASLAVLALAVLAVAGGASLPAGILIAAFSPVVVVVAFETIGHRHQAEALREVLPD